MAERFWTVLAAVLAVVAGVFLWRNNLPAAFVTATLGAVAWFLSYRAQLRAKITAAEEVANDQEIYEEPDEE